MPRGLNPFILGRDHSVNLMAFAAKRRDDLGIGHSLKLSGKQKFVKGLFLFP
jgi:hypothetical protein